MKLARMLPAGLLNRRVTIQTVINDTANDTGEVPPAIWRSYKRWAAIAPSSGREFQAAMQTMASTPVIVKLRYDSQTKTITERDRLLLGERILNIASAINEQEANQTIVLTCVEAKVT